MHYGTEYQQAGLFVPVLRAVALFRRDVQLANLAERHAQATLHPRELRRAVSKAQRSSGQTLAHRSACLVERRYLPGCTNSDGYAQLGPISVFFEASILRSVDVLKNSEARGKDGERVMHAAREAS